MRPAPRGPPARRRRDLPRLAACQAALPGSRGEAYLRQRGIPLALAQQAGVGSAAPGTWPHAARDWRGGRVVFPHSTPDGRVVNLYGRAVGTAAQVPKAKRHDHLPGDKGFFNAAALQASAGPLWVCEGACDALALLAAGVPRVVEICGVPGWRPGRRPGRCGSWSWRSTPMPLGSSRGARWPARRRGTQAMLEPAAYGGYKDASAAWPAGAGG